MHQAHHACSRRVVIAFSVRNGCRIALWAGLLAGCLVGALPAPGQQPETAPASAVPQNLPTDEYFADFVHFIALGRFDIAAAYGERLVEQPDFTPERALQLADTYRHSRETLTHALGHPQLGPIADQVLRRVREGERRVRRDPQRILEWIHGLEGTARAEWLNTQRLQDSGEYAIPWMLKVLREGPSPRLRTRLIRTLPKIGRPAVEPLVKALDIPDPVLQQVVIEALAEIGYAQAVPYLKALVESPDTPEDVAAAARRALAALAPVDPEMAALGAADAFVALGYGYLALRPSLRADPREEQANIWTLRDEFLTPIVVPTRIHDELMAMRCAERALALVPDHAEAVALWLSADLRREAELGMNVEKPSPEPALASADATHPPDYPRALYFARAAGPRYCQRVLRNAVEWKHPAVALGAIAALRDTAGPASLVGTGDQPMPLVRCLEFPDQVVRLKAALTLGDALPVEPFLGADRVVPLLSEALAQAGEVIAIAVDPDEPNRNRVVGMLRSAGAKVIAGPGLLEVLPEARRQNTSVHVIFLASDVQEPGIASSLAMLRGEFLFATTPVVILTRPGQEALVERLVRDDSSLEAVPADAPPDVLEEAWDAVAARTGRRPLSPEEALGIALDAAEVLYRIALTNNPLLPFAEAEPALRDALAHPAEDLRIRAAEVLALAGTSSAQQALARVALDDTQSRRLRLAAMAALSESARRHGNLLSTSQQDALVRLVAEGPDLTLRTAASQALGALNLASNRASELIRRNATLGTTR